MLSIVKSMALFGLDGYLIDVQVDVAGGLPYWEIVGLPDTSIKEAKERVKTAIKNSGFELQSRRIVINLAPANTKKEGSFFDLPIAICILMNLEQVKKQSFQDTIFIGELSLDGKLNKINGVLPMCIEAVKLGIKRVILPKENAKEAAIVSNLEVIGANSLRQIVKYLNDEIKIEHEEVDIKNLFENNKKNILDFAEVKGQENIKRALEITAAGAHNCLLIGTPRFGKNNACKKNSINITRFKF